MIMAADPIQQADFNPRRGREPNPERMARVKYFSQQRSKYDEMMSNEVREAIATGHSYRQVAAAAGVSVSVIQRIMNSMGND